MTLVSLLAPAAALVAAYLLTIAFMPMVRWLATRLGLLDRPDNGRRRHDRAIPRLGGVAVFASIFIVGVVGALFEDREHLVHLMPLVIALAAGVTILFATGLVDDIRGVRPSVKIVVQLGAALIAYRAGFRVDNLMLTPESSVTLGALSLPVTLLWIVGLSNALNLVDGADGLAASVSAIALVATAISAAAVHDPTVLWSALALLGAMLGFLQFNWPPARIFLGDSGSLVVGFLLAVLSVKGATERGGSLHVLLPLFALAYPLLDTGISMLRRWLRGDPLARADGRHIHHQLRILGIGPRQSLLLICGLSAVIATLGLSATFAPPQFTVMIALAGVGVLSLIFVYGLRWLQYHEFLEAGSSLTFAAFSGRTVIRDRIHARDVAEALQRAETFDELTLVLERSAARFRFVHAELQGRPSGEPLPVQAHGAQTCKLEYPVTRVSPELSYPITLSIWCSIEGRGSPAGAERVAKIIAPAITGWLVAHGQRDGVKAILAERFPGVHAPIRGAAKATGTHSLRIVRPSEWGGGEQERAAD